MQNTECSGIMMQVCTKQGVTKPLVTGPQPEEEPHQLDMCEASAGGRGRFVCMAWAALIAEE